MGLFSDPKEQQRLQSLQRLEDKRLIFARELKQRGIEIRHALLVQVGGGFKGLGSSGSALYLLSGPAPGEDADFKIEEISGCPVRFDPYSIPGEGGGGILGFGKKGGVGYMVVIRRADGTEEQFEMVSSLQCVMEIEDKPLPLTSEVRRRGNANVVWDFSPVNARSLSKMVARWQEVL